MVLGTRSVSINDYGQGLLDTLRSNFLSVAHADFIAGFGSPKNKLMFRIRNMKKRQTSSWLNRILMLMLVVVLGVFMLPMSECSRNKKDDSRKKESSIKSDSTGMIKKQLEETLFFVEQLDDKRIVSAPVDGQITLIRFYEKYQYKKIYLRALDGYMQTFTADTSNLRFFVEQGDSVIKGQKLFECRPSGGFSFHNKGYFNFYWPGERSRFRFTSHFGEHIHLVNRERRMFHDGIDLSAPRGTPVRAAASGTVVETVYDYKKNRGYGRLVAIEHDGDYKTRYCHLLSFNVREGQIVEAGQIIGRVGSTGRSTAPHLHFELYEAGELVNPIYYLNEKEPDQRTRTESETTFFINLDLFSNIVDIQPPIGFNEVDTIVQFGSYMHSVTGMEHSNYGIEIRAKKGTPVYAAAQGMVIKTVPRFRPQQLYGKHIIIKHADGCQTRYAHLNTIDITEGDSVEQGQLIGHVGTTGWAYQPHLHFSLFFDDAPVDPLLYFAESLSKKTVLPADSSTINKPRFYHALWQDYQIISMFGWRIDPKSNEREFHDAVDFAAPVGTPVHAIANGIVREAESFTDSTGARYSRVSIEHTDWLKGFISRYLYLGDMFVHPGQQVEIGQVIAEVGQQDKGGSYLSIKILKNGKAINPLFYLELFSTTNFSSI